MNGERLILTPEHVQIRLAPAGPGSRFLALCVDFVLATAASTLLGSVLVPFLPGGLGYAVWGTGTFLINWGYHVYFETRHEGRSPGKRLMGLRVVDGRGLPLSLGQSFVRNVMRVLDAAPLFYGVGGLACQLDRHRRRLGDVAADTLVIREDRGLEPDARAVRSPEFNSLRDPRILRRVRRRIGLEEREFLFTLALRAPQLENRARFDLMDEVGRHYRARLEIDDVRLSGENLVKGLAAVLATERPLSAGAGGRLRPRKA